MDPEKPSSAALYYTSFYLHGVDEKRRVQIPAKWRPGETVIEFTLVTWPQSKEGTCLRVLPPKEMAKLMAQLEATANSDPTKVPLKRYIGTESEQVTVDKAGRICLPERMAKAADISNEAMLVGLLDKFEIWNPARYERVKATDSLMAAEAMRLMG
jgi:MraZ protein